MWAYLLARPQNDVAHTRGGGGWRVLPLFFGLVDDLPRHLDGCTKSLAGDPA